MDLQTMQTTWFILVAVLLGGYVILDGFDLGVGMWYLLGSEKDRRTMLAAIGPVWDGNEVWLVTAGGTLFAVFPDVYATVLSGFYLVIMLVLFSLIFRGVAVEFRNKVDCPKWRGIWDTGFAAGSSLAALLLGVVLGNILRGVPLDAEGNFTGSFIGLLNPYALLIGVAGCTIIATHGALYLAVKTAGDLHGRAMRWARSAVVVEAVVVAAAAVATALLDKRLLRNYNDLPILWALPAATGLGLTLLVIACRRGRAPLAFVLSSVTIAALWVLAGVGLYPDLVPASNGDALSLTITNASSSARTLTVVLVITLVGMPIVIGCQAWLHWVFRRPLKDDDGPAY